MVVVVLGAWTRLSDAGLSCPDWPTCYGQIVVPNDISDPLAKPLERSKAWKEMIHRYIATLLGLMAIIIFIIAVKKAIYKPLVPLSGLLLFAVILQGLLGALTVTELVHPGIVLMHLLGGFITTSIIFLLILKFRTHDNFVRGSHQNNNTISHIDKRILYLTIILLLGQIFLGGWTSANYAALSCGNYFPSCLGTYLHPIDLDAVFYWGEFGINYEYGILPESVKIAIQLLHRIGALVIVFVVLLLLYRLKKYQHLQKSIALISILLVVQVSLGIANILASLPIFIATMHNVVALILLLSLLKIAYYQSRHHYMTQLRYS